ncbi:MAG TPA: hypothetical protein VLA72_18135 [Anaerolineales bacterium]|nr:hypothetical protein [Anaerolineales bacterium]
MRLIVAWLYWSQYLCTRLPKPMGSVLKKMSGVKNPDLSKLPNEIAGIVQKEFETG